MANWVDVDLYIAGSESECFAFMSKCNLEEMQKDYRVAEQEYFSPARWAPSHYNDSQPNERQQWIYRYACAWGPNCDEIMEISKGFPGLSIYMEHTSSENEHIGGYVIQDPTGEFRYMQAWSGHYGGER